MSKSLLLAAARVLTYDENRPLTNASGFFFARGERLFLVTSRHVMFDPPSKHFPNRVDIEIHTDNNNLAAATGFSIPLYRNRLSLWRDGRDSAGEVDVAVIEIDRSALPTGAAFYAFTPQHLVTNYDAIDTGDSVLIVCFPLGFHDTLHHMPVVRHAVIASTFGLRFQGHGYFLTDARTHRGTSGAPVVMRGPDTSSNALPWRLLGIHSSRLDVGSRDEHLDEALGLNCAWYADILLALTN